MHVPRATMCVGEGGAVVLVTPWPRSRRSQELVYSLLSIIHAQYSATQRRHTTTIKVTTRGVYRTVPHRVVRFAHAADLQRRRGIKRAMAASFDLLSFVELEI